MKKNTLSKAVKSTLDKQAKAKEKKTVCRFASCGIEERFGERSRGGTECRP
jgi:hypothetical protein